MQSGSRYIIAAGISSFALSLLYFLSLTVHLPFFITVPVIIAAVLLVFTWVIRDRNRVVDTVPNTLWAWLALLAGICLIVKGAYPLAEKYGGWDAWGIWNYHAKYLADPVNWKKMFQNISFAHPDYPLYIPAVNGFFIRLFPGKSVMVVPFIFNFTILLFIPVLIYLETVKKNIVVAAAVLLLFATDTFYLTKGVTQYADTPLAFFFLCAFVCINYAREDGKYISLAAASLGCCMWTKNEGSILALVFIMCYATTFFSSWRSIKAFLVGIGLPLFVFLLFKICYAPDGAILSSQGKGSFSQLFIKDRYDLIWNSFKDNVAQKYYYVKICVFIYMLLCVIERKWPDKQFMVLICCTAAYILIYVLTPGNIEWLLMTSQERLMHQLMPALMYVLAQRFARVQFLLPAQQEAL